MDLNQDECSEFQRLLMCGGQARVGYVPNSTDRSCGTRVDCPSRPMVAVGALKERGREMVQRKRCYPVVATWPQMVKDHVSAGLGMCPDSPEQEGIKFKLEQGLQHVDGVTEHRLPFTV